MHISSATLTGRSVVLLEKQTPQPSSSFYCRVLEESLIEARQTMEVIERDLSQPTVASVVAKPNMEEGI